MSAPIRGFVPVPNRLIAEAECAADVAVYAVVASWRDWNTGIADIGVKKIADLAHVSKPTVLSRLEWLQSRGFLTITKSSGHTQRQAYRLPDSVGTGKSENRSISEPVSFLTGQNEAPELVNVETGTGQSGNHVLRKKNNNNTPAAKSPPDARAAAFKSAFWEGYQTANSIPPPWDGKEAANLARFLKSNPAITLEHWRAILKNRSISPVNQKASMSTWLGRALAWLDAPADDWGRPLHGGNGNGHGSNQQSRPGGSQATANVHASQGAFAAAAERLRGSTPSDPTGANVAAVSTPRSERVGGGIPVGLPAAGAAVLAQRSAFRTR